MKTFLSKGFYGIKVQHNLSNGINYMVSYNYFDTTILPGTSTAALMLAPEGGYNIDNAVNYLNDNANERSVHACGRYVGLALQAGGLKGTMADGKDYGPILLKNNFQIIKNLSSYNPLKGDVTVYDGNASHKWGHVQMYNGQQWVSDFFQGYIGIRAGYEYGGSGFMVYRTDIPQTTIYRYNK